MSLAKALSINDIIIRSPTPDDLPALRALVPAIFVRKEPMASYAKVPVEKFITGYDQIASNLDFHTSTIATLPSGEIIGTFFGTPFPGKFDTSGVDRDTMDLYALLVHLDMWFVNKFDIMGANSHKKVLHLSFGTTADGYEGMGISKRLRAETLRKARETGQWDYAIVECSNLKTQHLMRDVFGFEVGLEVAFKDHEVEGRKPLEGMEGTILFLYSELQIE